VHDRVAQLLEPLVGALLVALCTRAAVAGVALLVALPRLVGLLEKGLGEVAVGVGRE
jgi:hypothetical protein